jgi:excisionase family DNA binding protein
MTIASPETRPSLTPAAVAVRLGVSRETVNHWLDTGQLRSIDVGTESRRFRRTSEVWLADFLAGKGKESPS